MKSNYAKRYEAALSEGYGVSSARTYIDRKQERTELVMDTPFTYKGEALTGYAVVHMDTVDVDARDVNTRELWHNGRNLEDVAGINDGTAETVLVQDKDGNTIDYKQALDQMGSFARDASGHEHVMTYDEYVQVYNNTHDKPHLKDFGPFIADEQKYEKYLDSAQNLMRDGMKYIGEITTPEDVDRMRMTTPSFAEEMQKLDERQRDTSELGISEDISPDLEAVIY